MKKLLECRRTFLGTLGILSLTFLGYNGVDVASSISTIIIAVAGANAAQGVFSGKK